MDSAAIIIASCFGIAITGACLALWWSVVDLQIPMEDIP